MNEFQPTAEKLLPNLTAREELVLLARTLWREGYDDHLAGHITIRQPDGTFLCNPWYLLWCELRPEHVIRIDLAGRVLEGDWPAPLGIPLHLELHKRRHDIGVALHNHPRYGTIWADVGRVPPVYDQSSGLGGGDVTVVDEYKGAVNDTLAAAAAVEAMGNADIALLANHGVFILGSTVRAVHQRAVAFEQRCRHAWRVEALGGGRKLPEPALSTMRASDGTRFIGFWEAMVRLELAADPTLLASR
ncbi:MAG TPA: class II aldolase/adducin family protein [Acidimicrobiales bacterium]|nr:class II aldolase/adducin family protein [Acidimicrobiales bacterium]